MSGWKPLPRLRFPELAECPPSTCLIIDDPASEVPNLDTLDAVRRHFASLPPTALIPGLARELALDPRTIRALKANADLNLTHPAAEPDRLFGIPVVESPLPDDVLAVAFNRPPNGLPDVEGMVVVKKGGV